MLFPKKQGLEGQGFPNCHGFSGDIRGPTQKGLGGLFVDVGAPPTGEKLRKPSAMESSVKESISLSQVPPPQPESHARGQ